MPVQDCFFILAQCLFPALTIHTQVHPRQIVLNMHKDTLMRKGVKELVLSLHFQIKQQ